MKTAVICFEGGSIYTKQKQFNKILKEEYENYGWICKDYDELDAFVPILRERGYNKLVIMHDDRSLDVFENAAQKEYSHLFEKIECVPDFSIGLEHLYEAGVVAAGQGTQAPTQGGTAQKGVADLNQPIFIFPINAPVKGANKLLADLKGQIIGGGNNLFNVCTFKADQTGHWGWSAINNCSLIKNGTFVKNANYGFARSVGGIIRLKDQKADDGQPSTTTAPPPGAAPAPGGLKISASPQMIEILKNDPAAGGVQFIPINGGDIDRGLAVEAYKHGAKILSSPTKNLDEGKIKEYLDGKMTNKTSFLIKVLADIKETIKNNDKDITDKDGKSIVNIVLDGFGVYKTMQNQAEKIKQGGGDLFLSAGSTIIRAGQELAKSPKKEDKTENSAANLIISHQSFEAFAACFDDPGDFMEANK